MGAEEVLRVEVKACLRALEDQVALNLDAGGDDERARLSEPLEGLPDQASCCCLKPG